MPSPASFARSFLRTLMFGLIASFAWAGASKAGDGGDALVCYDGRVRIVRLFDLVELEHFPSLATQRDFESSNIDARAPEFFLNEARNRAAQILGVRHPFNVLMSFADYNGFKIELLTSEDIFDVDDAGSTPFQLPKNCVIAGAGFNEPSDGNSIKLNRVLWPDLPNRDRAALLVHESLHPWFFREADTATLRRVVRLLFSDRLAHDEIEWFKETVDERMK